MTLYVGTSGWSYPGGEGRWDGVFYPRSVPDREKLGFYARYFAAVEVNTTFYRPPNPAMTRAWAAKVPEDFRFAAKLWQKFTHPKMFADATGQAATIREEDFDQFSLGLAPLAEAGKLGPLLVQFPPSFKADPGSLDYLSDLVRRFGSAGFQLAIELRHRSWTDPDGAGPAVAGLLAEEGAAWVMIDEPKFRTSVGEAPLTSRVGYFRFHGRNYAQWWHHEQAEDRYNYLYTAAEQRELTREVREVAARTDDTYVFYNNHYKAKAVVNALQLELEAGRPVRAPLPDTLVREYPELEVVQAIARSEVPPSDERPAAIV